MNIRQLTFLGTFALSCAALSASPMMAAGTSSADPGLPSASFSVQNSTQIPGKTLKSGTYSIRIVDHLHDRMIISVEQANGKATVFLALPTSSLAKPSTGGAILVKGGPDAKAALRGFAFPDGTVAEFVYPKAEAVSLAKANDTTIPAIDPASEGKSASPGGLSSQDMQEVTLWMLTPTTVGPNDTTAAIKAERYQQTATASTPTTTPVRPSGSGAGVARSQQVASASVPTPPPTPRVKPVVAVLPHTASMMPLTLLMGLFAAAIAGFFTTRRLRQASKCFA